ncbi:membrane protein of unknown function [Pseudodesulfovibrio profundus]|uniref:Uncharacterized protein n=2 Tax=Pseudodesulfovibrio profundus TaxID=57320 RepID=A0A2C8FB15_9BACT|nr:hypothetical protein [Desulfovibrio sp.]SOB59626.1 membrane protein of unknown function [Pseudodesulfovibrio profundus]
MNFLRQLWRGEVALVKTYWIFGVLASFLLNGIVLLLSRSLAGTGAIWPMFVFWFISIIYTLFIAVAIWRSADKYTGRKVWAILAKIMVVLSVLQTVLNVIGS